MQFYNVKEWPHIAILDPRTGTTSSRLAYHIHAMLHTYSHTTCDPKTLINKKVGIEKIYILRKFKVLRVLPFRNYLSDFPI